jgi:hypothetical protein
VQCPKCRLENPSTAQRCDCGYDFVSGQMKESYLAQATNQKVGAGRKPGRWTVIFGWTFTLLGGLIGIWIAQDIAYGKNKSDPSGRTYAYDEASRSHGKVMLVVAIAMMAFWLLYRIAPHQPR